MSSMQCSKCQGSGRFITFYGEDRGVCYKCKGAGWIEAQSEAAPGTNQHNSNRPPMKMHREEKQPIAFFPKIVRLVLEKNVKLYLGACKITMFQDGRLALVAPTFGGGIYGYFNKESGGFAANKSCTPEMILMLQDVEQRGMEAVKDIGALTGNCCVCGRVLTNEDSIEDGIGPVCSGKMEGF